MVEKVYKQINDRCERNGTKTFYGGDKNIIYI